MKKITEYEEGRRKLELFEKWWKAQEKKGQKYLVDFGCQHAFLAGYQAGKKIAFKKVVVK